MQSMRTSTAAGFTLVEVVVVAPIIILFIGAFIGVIVSLTGESLRLRETNAAAYNVQDAIDDMQKSAGGALKFLSTTGPVQSPQGTGSTANPIINASSGQPDTLIIKSPATTKNPQDATAEAIYSGTGSCNNQNSVYPYTTVYMVVDQTLYKRTILQQSAACKVPWQRNSCKEADVTTNSTVCQVQDEKLLENVAALDIRYYSNAYTTTQLNDNLAESANSISISITLTKSVAGDPLSYSGSARISNTNIQSNNNETTPANANIMGTPSSSDPYTTNFTWDKAGNATSYRVRYRPDTSASWLTTTINVTNPSQGQYTHDVSSVARKQTAEIEVTVNTSSGSYLYGTSSRTLPRWNDCSYQNSWTTYGTPYARASFTKTSSGIVGLRGLVKNGTVGQSVCTLPAGFRPKFAGERLIFQVAGVRNGANSWARVDVLATGEVVVVSGENPWVSLDGIMFLADTTNYTWTNNTWLNGWSWYGTGHSTLRSTLDSVGRVHVQGLGARSGAVAATTTTGLGASKGVSNQTHSPALAAGGAAAVNITTDGNINGRVAAANHSWQQLQLIYHPSSFSSWQTIPLTNSWGNYGAPWPTAKCYKGPDDVVIMTGLINRPAGSGDGLAIGNTATAGCGSYSEGDLLLHAFYAGENPGRIDIVNGSMIPRLTSPTWTSLDGVRFIAD